MLNPAGAGPGDASQQGAFQRGANLSPLPPVPMQRQRGNAASCYESPQWETLAPGVRGRHGEVKFRVLPRHQPGDEAGIPVWNQALKLLSGAFGDVQEAACSRTGKFGIRMALCRTAVLCVDDSLTCACVFAVLRRSTCRGVSDAMTVSGTDSAAGTPQVFEKAAAHECVFYVLCRSCTLPLTSRIVYKAWQSSWSPNCPTWREARAAWCV
jgi:hypothetical protein